MFTFLARRIASGLVLIVVVSAIAFTLVYSDGNRIARVILGPTASQESVRLRAEELGLNDPLPVQFARYFGNAAQFNARNGELCRALMAWQARATSSLPVPVSPWINSGASRAATRWARALRVRITGDSPSSASKPSA